MNIDQQQVLDELERLLSSPGLRSRKLIKRFLRYVVQETLEGRGEQLNQYSIAVNALGKPEDFSPAYNPIVRIEAGRLRKLLEKYYATAPQSTTLVISIPRGTYQAQFLTQPQYPTQSSVISEDFTSRVTEGPRIFTHFQIPDGDNNGETSLAPVLFRLRGELLLALSRFRNIRLVSSTSLATRQTLTGEFLQEIRQAYRADYLLNCDACRQATGNGFTLRYTLAHTPTDEIVWTDQISLSDQPEQQELDSMYRWLVANAISLHSGAALHHWVEYQQAIKAPLPASQKPLVDYIAFLRNISLDRFVTALSSCRERLQEFPDDSKALVILARLCGYDHTLQYNQITDLEAEWTAASRMAMKLDPGNAEAHSVFAHNSYYRDDYALSRAELETARHANPYDTACEYLYGLGFCLMGEWDKGMAAIQGIMDIPFNQPAWYHVLPFLHEFNRQNHAAALVHAERIQDFAYWGGLARTVTLFRLGKRERAVAEAYKLLSAHPHVIEGKNRPDQRKLSSHPSIAAIWQTIEEMQLLLTQPDTQEHT